MKRIGAWWVPDSENHPKTISQMENGGFQSENIQPLLNYVSNFNACIDGGAHVGSWTHEFCKHFGTVYAFEADPLTFDCLKQNMSERNITNTRLFDLALGDEEKDVGIVRQLSVVSHYVTEGTGATMITLDSLSYDSLGLIKLDVEGYESRALLGAEKTIRTHQPVIMFEFKPHIHERGSAGLPTPAEILKDYGYVKLGDLNKKDFVWGPRKPG